MTRRQSIKFGTLFAIGMALGKMDTLKAADGQLLCDLSQWGHVVFVYKGKRISIGVDEIFASLASNIKQTD